MTVHVNCDASKQDLPFYGKVRLVKRGPWVPCVFWMTGGVDEDATYWAWINGETKEVPDPLQSPRWPWHPAEPAEWLTLYREWENTDAQQR